MELSIHGIKIVIIKPTNILSSLNPGLKPLTTIMIICNTNINLNWRPLHFNYNVQLSNCKVTV